MTIDPTKSDLFITQYFQFAFNSRPDTYGTYFWTNAADKGYSLTAIASAFVYSPEFQNAYGVLTNSQFVNTLQSNWGGHFSSTQVNNWVSQLNSGVIDRGTALYQMVDAAGVPDASARLTFFGDSGTARAGGHQFYYENGGAAQHAMGAFFRTDGAFYKVTDIAELGDCAYAAGSSTTYDDSVGADYNQFMYPYPSPYYLQAPYTTTANYINTTLNNNQISKDYPSTNIAINGNKVWPYNIYNYPFGYANPETGGLGGSTDGQNHFWPTPGNHDYGARVGYTDTNNTASNSDTAYPVGMTSSGVPAPYIDYFAFMRNTALLGSQAKSISIGSVDNTGQKGIYYSVKLGDQGNGKPLIELFSIDTERLNTNAGINDELSDGYNGDHLVQPVAQPNYFYDPSKPYNPANKNTVALLSSDPANGQAQYNWLKTELQNSDAKWKIIYGHQPIYSTGKMGNALGTDHGTNPVLQNFLKQLVGETGVNFDAWVNGHTHYYERVLEQNTSGIGEGIPFITNGNSGRSLYQTYQVDYGQSLYAPQDISQSAYLNGITNFLPSDPVMAGVSAELKKFIVTTNSTNQTKITPVGPILPGTYGDGYGAVSTAADKSYLFFDYVQTDVLDPAILANINPATRGVGLKGWDGLTVADWTPKTPAKDDTALLDIVVGLDGSISTVKIAKAGAGYMAPHGGKATVDFEIRGNDSLDPTKTVNPNNYAIVTLEFDNGSLKAATLKSAGLGYTHAAQAMIADGLNTYATLAPTVDLLNKYPLELPINVSVFAGDDNIKPDTQYQDWYLITDTKANVALTQNGAINATVTVTPQSQAATDIISTHDLTTGYSGTGQQQKFYTAQSGKVTIFDTTSGLALGSGTLVNGVANFSLSGLPSSKLLKVDFSGDATSSYQINFKASSTVISTDDALRPTLTVVANQNLLPDQTTGVSKWYTPQTSQAGSPIDLWVLYETGSGLGASNGHLHVNNGYILQNNNWSVFSGDVAPGTVVAVIGTGLSQTTYTAPKVLGVQDDIYASFESAGLWSNTALTTIHT